MTREELIQDLIDTGRALTEDGATEEELKAWDHAVSEFNDAAPDDDALLSRVKLSLAYDPTRDPRRGATANLDKLGPVKLAIRDRLDAVDAAVAADVEEGEGWAKTLGTLAEIAIMVASAAA